jgi:hypothetical protein
MELIKNYVNALQAIYDHVGFRENWVIFPIDDCTDKIWNTDGKNVYFADSKEEFSPNSDSFRQESIYEQRFYSKWIYQGEKFTMIFCNSGVDGMKYFRIFDNAKRS